MEAMLWIPLTVAAYFLNGLASVLDKVLISSRIPNPVVYTFWVGILSAGVVILVPFGFEVLPLDLSLKAVLAGTSFLIALYFLFTALKETDASRLFPLIGGISPVFSLIAEGVLFSKFTTLVEELLPIGFFVGGTILLSLKYRGQIALNPRSLAFVILSSFFLAMSFIISKDVYSASNFLPAFIWIRLGSFLAALFFLFSPKLRGQLVFSDQGIKPSSLGFLFLSKSLAALSFFMLNYALFLGPVSIINAMRGFEYLSIFLFSAILTVLFPSVIQESLERGDVLLKIAGAVLISAAFLFLI